MDHEQLAHVPPICEICYGPADPDRHVIFNWPGSYGLRVYICKGACYQAAVKHLRQRSNRGPK